MSHHYRGDERLEARPTVVGLHFRVGKKIGEGSFGIIHEGVNVLDNRTVAIKFESKRSDAPQLRDEYKSYKLLAGTVGIPAVYYYGQEGSFNCLVIDLLGHSLEDLFDLCGRRFSLKTVCMLAKQMVLRIRSVHERHLIYRDIKPDNFLMGRRDRSHIVHLVDFGMAKHYRDPKTRQHIPYKERKSLSGTARYMSINTHLGREQSRRDDLESLGHVFLYFLLGELPWQGLKAPTNKQKYEKIGLTKQSVPVKELCQKCPEAFASYLYYVRGLQFEEEPDYAYLTGLFDTVMAQYGFQEDGLFDWMLLPRREAAVDQGSIRSFPPNLPHTAIAAGEPGAEFPNHKSVGALQQGFSSARKISYGPAHNASVRPLYDMPIGSEVPLGSSPSDAPLGGGGLLAYPKLTPNSHSNMDGGRRMGSQEPSRTSQDHRSRQNPLYSATGAMGRSPGAAPGPNERSALPQVATTAAGAKKPSFWARFCPCFTKSPQS